MAGHFQEFEDEYLETLYEFHESAPFAQVRTGDIADRLGVSPASVSEMIQRLASKGFVEHEPYKGVTLTELGLSHGQQMKRRHRLAEVLLDLLPFEGDAHATACRLEHAIDDDLEVALSTLIGDLRFDPSGRPIPPAHPDLSSRIKQSHGIERLCDIKLQGKYTIRMMIFPFDILESFSEVGLRIGAEVSFHDQSIVLQNGHHLNMDDEWHSKIWVEPMNQR